MEAVLIKNCIYCQRKIKVFYNHMTKDYIQKNNIDFWTLKKEDEGKYSCSKCIRSLYCSNHPGRRKKGEAPFEEKFFGSKQKKTNFSVYVYNNSFKNEEEEEEEEEERKKAIRKT